MLKKKVSKGRPTKSPQKSPKNIPAMEIAANTEAMPITPEVSPVLPIEHQKEDQKEPQFSHNIPFYRLGCPRCSTKILVTEQKYHGKRLCRCRECGWRGEMI